MKRPMEERMRNKLLHIGKRNPLLRVPAIMAMTVVILAFHLIDYCRGNVKRFAMVVMTFMLFAAYSSFSFPIFQPDDSELPGALGSWVEEQENVSLAQETEIVIEDVELLDDKDVLDEEEYSGHSHSTGVQDKYAVDEILESNEEYHRTETGNQEQSLSENESPNPVFSKDDWRLVLINKQNSVPDDYTFTLGTITGNMKCDERIIEDLLAMLQGAKDDGVNLVVCSPYRDIERQEMLFERKINRYMNKGMSYMEAYQLSSQVVTVPGASEHQIGLALDIVCDHYYSLDEGFGETEAGKWLVEHCAEYGFILRYPDGKEYITGIEYEPWHFRYVGKEAAQVIMEEHITLEEFWEDL